MMGKFKCFCRCMVAVILSGVAFSALAVSNQIAVIVNDDIITEQELVSKRQFINSDPSNPLNKKLRNAQSDDQAKNLLIDSMVEELVQRQYAKRVNFSVPSNVVDAEIAKLARTNKLSVAQFRDAVASSGLDWGSFNREIETRLIIQGLIRNVVAKRISVSDFEIEEFLRQSDLRNQSGTYDFEHLLVKLSEGEAKVNSEEEDALVEELQKIQSVSASIEEFRAAAQQLVNTSSRVEFRDVGKRSAGQLPDLFVNEFNQLSENQVTSMLRSDSALHLMYLKSKEVFMLKDAEKRKLSHILITATSPEERKVAFMRLNQIRQRAIEGEDFSKLAAENSDDPRSAALGGDLGWVKKGDTVPEFERAGFSLKPKMISQPLATQYGVHIIKVIEVSQQSQDESMRAIARSRVMAQKANQQYPVWLSDLVSQAYVKR